MKGNVLGFDPDSNTGAITGHDGQRYDFVRLEWRGPGRPGRGETVDFIADSQRATQIYPLVTRFDPNEGSDANTVYILYLVSLLVGITSIVGVIMAYVNRSDAPEWVQTHYPIPDPHLLDRHALRVHRRDHLRSSSSAFSG